MVPDADRVSHYQQPNRLDLLGAQRRGQLRAAGQRVRFDSGERDQAGDAREHPVLARRIAIADAIALSDAHRDGHSEADTDCNSATDVDGGRWRIVPGRIQREQRLGQRLYGGSDGNQHGRRGYQWMAPELGLGGQSNHHAGVELSVIAERAERDADERIVERRDSGGRKSDRDWIQCELQRIEPGAGGVLPERNPVRVGIGHAADSDADLKRNGNAHRDSHGHRDANRDSHNAADGHSDLDADRNGNRYSDADCDADGHSHGDIDIASDGDADSRRTGELSRQLLS